MEALAALSLLFVSVILAKKIGGRLGDSAAKAIIRKVEKKK